MYCMFCGRYHSNCPRFCTLCGEVHDFVKDEGDYGDTDDDGTSSAVPVDWSHTMGPKRNQQLSPEQSAAKRLKKKYTRKSPTKGDRVKKALYEVSQNKVSIRKAAKKYSLSYGFLHRRLSGEVAVDSRNGPETVFTSAEEEAMAKWLKEMAEKGLALMPGEFLDFVQRVVNEEKRDGGSADIHCLP